MQLQACSLRALLSFRPSTRPLPSICYTYSHFVQSILSFAPANKKRAKKYRDIKQLANINSTLVLPTVPGLTSLPLSSSSRMPSAMASSRLPLCSASRSVPSTNKKTKKHDAGRGALGEVLRVVRRDREFVNKRLQSAGKSTRPLRDRISRTIGGFFWLRHLENPKTVDEPLPSSSLPQISSYTPGLSGMDLLLADLEALKVYVNYLRHASQVWSMPLPEVYDPQRVANYFSCRPHVLMFRMLEVFSSFTSAAIKLQTSKTFKMNKHEEGRDNSRDSPDYFTGQLLKESMLKLGPTFVKVGQSISTRPDIIGSEISKALSELHDKIPPFPRTIAMKIIEEEFGCPVENIFSYISEEPVAAASFGQVYRGCTLDGSAVAVKVQRPNLLHAVVRDVYILRLGILYYSMREAEHALSMLVVKELALLRKIANRKSDLCLYADELGKGLVGELDYTLEAANAAKFAEAHSQYSFMVVPKVFKHLTRKKVLTMEWMVGESPNDLLLQAGGFGNEKIDHPERQQLEAKKHLLNLVNKGAEASLVQLLETGLLHADPHPGNLRYTPEGRIGFLDFGLLCQMEKKHQFAMLASIMHIVNGDWESLVYDLTLMDVIRPGTNLRRVTLDLEGSLGEVVFRDGIPDIKFSRVLGKIWSVALKYDFRMPPYFTLVLRSLASLEGLAMAGDPQFKTFQAAYPYVVQKLLYDNSAPTRAILYSVVFNKRREFQWHKILMFLRVGSLSGCRKGAHDITISSMDKSPGHRKNVQGDMYEVANLILRLLSAKNGVVLRRLLLTVDAVSLTQTAVSKDAAFFRQHVSRTLADVICRWMLETLGVGKASAVGEVERQENRDTGISSAPSASSAVLLQNALRDRRLKVIFSKMVKDVRQHPILMLRACWCCFTIFATALALALHRVVVYWSEMFSTSVAFVPKRVAVSV